MTPAAELGYEPTEIAPPGETLVEWLDQAGMSQAQFAKRVSLTPKHINQVVKGTASISPEVALAFERVTGIPARYWSQLEANFQAAKQREVETETLRARTDLADLFPVKELVARGYVEDLRAKVDQLRELLRFFAVADPDALERVWLRPALYRRSKAFEPHDGAVASWLRIAELEADQIETEPFDAGAARGAIPEMRKLTMRPGVSWLKPLTDLCASVGIALVVVKELPKCRLNGATRWLSADRAMIALSLRHRRNDIFWFTFFHELCHVLRHSKKETFIDLNKDSGVAEELEDEADAFASRTLIPTARLDDLWSLNTKAQVTKFADAIGIAPGIVVGRMQHEELIPHNQWTDLIARYRFADD